MEKPFGLDLWFFKLIMHLIFPDAFALFGSAEINSALEPNNPKFAEGTHKGVLTEINKKMSLMKTALRVVITCILTKNLNNFQELFEQFWFM